MTDSKERGPLSGHIAPINAEQEKAEAAYIKTRRLNKQKESLNQQLAEKTEEKTRMEKVLKHEQDGKRLEAGRTALAELIKEIEKIKKEVGL